MGTQASSPVSSYLKLPHRWFTAVCGEVARLHVGAQFIAPNQQGAMNRAPTFPALLEMCRRDARVTMSG